MKFKKSGKYLNILSLMLGILSIAFYPGFTVSGIKFAFENFFSISGVLILLAVICAVLCIIFGSIAEKKIGHPPLMAFFGFICVLAISAHLMITVVFIFF